LAFFRKAREQYTEILQSTRRLGHERVAIVGGGELADIAVLAASGEGVPVAAIIEPGAREGSRRFGVPVAPSLAEVGSLDAVIIADEHAPQAVYEELRTSFPNDRIFAPALLRITPDRDELMLAAARKERK
jgi:hypothetical protein